MERHSMTIRTPSARFSDFCVGFPILSPSQISLPALPVLNAQNPMPGIGWCRCDWQGTARAPPTQTDLATLWPTVTSPGYKLANDQTFFRLCSWTAATVCSSREVTQKGKIVPEIISSLYILFPLLGLERDTFYVRLKRETFCNAWQMQIMWCLHIGEGGGEGLDVKRCLKSPTQCELL